MMKVWSPSAVANEAIQNINLTTLIADIERVLQQAEKLITFFQ